MVSSVKASGVKELRAIVEGLPRAVTLALRGVAWNSSRKIRTEAQRILRSKTHGRGRTADAIVVIEEEQEQQFVVVSQGHPDDPANLPLWLERGTKYMAARPYMRPAGDAEDAHYKRESMKAAEAVGQTLERA